MTTVRILHDGIRELERSPEVAALLGNEAATVQRRVRAPSHLRLSTRKGVGPRGAFAQVIMRGRGVIPIEFGSRNNAPMAPLRNALRGKG